MMEWIRLSEICKTTQGVQISKLNQCNTDGESRIRYLYIEDFKSAKDVKYIDPQRTNVSEKIVTVEDLVMANTGSPGAVYKGVDGVLSNNLFKISFDKNLLDRDYLYYILSSSIFQKMLEKKMKGGIQKHLGHKTIGEQSIPIYSLDDQRKIVEILNNAKKLMELRQSQITALDELMQSLFLEMFGDPVSNSKRWSLTKLSELGEWKSGGTPLRSKKDYYTGNIPWLSSGELNELYTFDSQEYITERAIKESSAKYIEEGSLLLGMYDTAALKSTINKVPCTCNQAIAFAKVDDSIMSTIYLYHFIQFSKEHLKREQRGVRQKNLNLSMIKNLIVMKPHIDLQKEFEGKVLVILDKKELLRRALDEVEALYNALLQKAFKGELFQNQV